MATKIWGHLLRQKNDQAIQFYKRSKAIDLKQVPKGPPELANIYATLGKAYAQKQYKKGQVPYPYLLLETLKQKDHAQKT